MTLKELSLYINNEEATENYLKSCGILKTFTACIACGSTHIGRIRRSKLKCYECRVEWNIRKDSILEKKKISFGAFLGCIKLFTDGLPVSKCAEELEIGLKITKHLFTDIRTFLLDRRQIVVPDSHEIIFYLKVINGSIFVEAGHNSEESSRGALITATRTKVNESSYLYKFRYKNLTPKRIVNEIDRIDSLDIFYRFYQERLLKYRGRNINSLAEFLYELAYRYNHRHEDLFQIIIAQLALKTSLDNAQCN